MLDFWRLSAHRINMAYFGLQLTMYCKGLWLVYRFISEHRSDTFQTCEVRSAKMTAYPSLSMVDQLRWVGVNFDETNATGRSVQSVPEHDKPRRCVQTNHAPWITKGVLSSNTGLVLSTQLPLPVPFSSPQTLSIVCHSASNLCPSFLFQFRETIW